MQPPERCMNFICMSIKREKDYAFRVLNNKGDAFRALKHKGDTFRAFKHKKIIRLENLIVKKILQIFYRIFIS